MVLVLGAKENGWGGERIRQQSYWNLGDRIQERGKKWLGQLCMHMWMRAKLETAAASDNGSGNLSLGSFSGDGLSALADTDFSIYTC